MYLFKKPERNYSWIETEFGEIEPQLIYFTSEIQSTVEFVPLARITNPNVGFLCIQEGEDYMRWWIIDDQKYILSAVQTLDIDDPTESAFSFLELSESLASMMPGEPFHLYTPHGEVLDMEVVDAEFELDNSALYYLVKNMDVFEVPQIIQTYNKPYGMVDLFLDRISLRGIESLHPKDKQFMDSLSYYYSNV